MSKQHYMLVDAQTLRPVPLPHYCADGTAIHDWCEATDSTAAKLHVTLSQGKQRMWVPLRMCAEVKLITEVAYMEAQQ